MGDHPWDTPGAPSPAATPVGKEGGAGAKTSVEKKWQTNLAKVAFAKSFPGQMTSWGHAAGKTIDCVVPLVGRSVCVVIFTDRTFIVNATAPLEPAEQIASLLVARPLLAPHYKTAYQLLDQYIAADQEMQRMARLENILGAVRNNLPQIPEIKEALKRLLAD